MKTEYLLNRQLNHVLAALTLQNRLICEVELHTGLRIGDVLALKTDQIARKFWVTEKKTGKRRQVGLTDNLIYRIRAQSGPVWAFPGTREGKPKTRQAVWRDIKRASEAFRLPQIAGTHSMRKIYAVDLMKRYGDIGRVQRALNHSSPSVTLLCAMADKLLQEAQQEGGTARQRR